MDFLIQWLCYLAAFVAGSSVACFIADVVRKRAASQPAAVDVASPAVGGR